MQKHFILRYNRKILMQLTAPGGTDTFKFIPRKDWTSSNASFVKCILRDDSTNKEITFDGQFNNVTPSGTTATGSFSYPTIAYTGGSSTQEDFYTFTVTLGGDNASFFVEGHFYDIKFQLKDGASDPYIDVYRDKLFCTAQTVNQVRNEAYEINNNEFITEDTNNNDYIIV